MKFIKISIVAIAISSLTYATIVHLDEMSKVSTTENSTTIANQQLLKKWMLSHYELFGTNIDSEGVEKNDYIHFFKDLTYKSVSEGKYETGKYRVSESNILLSNKVEKGELKFIIKKLTETTLSVSIDNPNDSDAKYLTIHFKPLL